MRTVGAVCLSPRSMLILGSCCSTGIGRRSIQAVSFPCPCSPHIVSALSPASFAASAKTIRPRSRTYGRLLHVVAARRVSNGT